jgi:maltoporin
MAIKRIFPIAVAVSSALFTMSAQAVDFHGYARAGMATTSDGGDQICYGSGAAAHFVGRLGDECETYVELDLGQEVYNRDNKVFKIESMVAYQTPEGQQNGQGNDYQAVDPNGTAPWSGITQSFRQMFVTAQGVVGFAPGATLWAGKRYYQRKDLHILDMFYVNDSGYGVGLEGIAAGPGRLSVAVVNMDQNANSGNVQSNKLDVRYSGIPLWSGATLELIGIVAKADPTKSQEAAVAVDGNSFEDGSFFTAEIQHAFMGGFNKIVYQHGADSMGGSAYWNHGGGNVVALPNSSGWGTGQLQKSDRIMDFGVIKPTRNIDMMYAVIYQKATAYNGDEYKRTSVVARPVFAVNDVQSVALELGWTKEEFNGDDTNRNLRKWMVAYQFSAGRGFWARPQIRFYAGEFSGDQAENINDANNLRVGAQIEAWW